MGPQHHLQILERGRGRLENIFRTSRAKASPHTKIRFLLPYTYMTSKKYSHPMCKRVSVWSHRWLNTVTFGSHSPAWPISVGANVNFSVCRRVPKDNWRGQCNGPSRENCVLVQNTCRYRLIMTCGWIDGPDGGRKTNDSDRSFGVLKFDRQPGSILWRTVCLMCYSIFFLFPFLYCPQHILKYQCIRTLANRRGIQRCASLDKDHSHSHPRSMAPV